MRLFILSIPTFFLLTACSQTKQTTEPKLLGAPCEGCEAVFEYDDRKLTSTDTLAGFPDQGEPLIVRGTVFQSDGQTPAKGVILYAYHTNADGIYPTKGGETDWSKRHGYMRGWIKTDSDGKYAFYTIRPASYPNTTVVQHIHATVLEPDGSYYYIQDFLFDDDPNLSERDRKRSNPRGGAGYILSLTKKDGTWVGERDIILRRGLN